MLGNRFLLSRYNRAPLTVKISVPFILLFLISWGVGTWSLGKYFAEKLERKQREQTERLTALMEREIAQTLQALGREARLLSIEPTLADSLVLHDQNRLNQAILPLKSILGSDLIDIVDTDGQLLLEARQQDFKDVEVYDELVVNLLLTGSEVTTVVTTEGSSPPLLMGTAPIKDDQGVVGGVMIGIALDDDLLRQLNAAIKEEIVVMDQGTLVASSFPPDASLVELLSSQQPSGFTTFNQDYFTQSIQIAGLGDTSFDIILLISRQSLRDAQQRVWRVVLFVGLMGAGLMSVLGYLISRKLAQPMLSITHIAQQVVTQGDFNVRAPIHSEDEIGALATALNQLIIWVGDYTHELELASETLEDQVKDRTQELAETLEDLKETQGQLIQTEKMSSLGQMVAGIAHEINNPIGFIQGNLNPLRDYFQDLLDLLEVYQAEYPQPTEAVLEKQEEVDLEFLLADLTKLLGSMKMGTQRVRDIVVSLRNYSRLDEATIKNVNLHEGIDGTLLILNHRLKKGVKVITAYGELPLVRCSPAQLNQVFTNIIANALDAMFDANSTPKELTITTDVSDTEHVQIKIRDTGPGMTPEVKAKIFDPFFTTKSVGKGTGLGMGICFKIIHQHQGTLEVISAPGEGTEFVITLPRDAQPLESTEPSEPSETQSEGKSLAAAGI